VLAIAAYELGAVSEHSANVLDRGVRRTDRTSTTTQSKQVFFKVYRINIGRESRNGLAGRIISWELVLDVRWLAFGQQ
jgi:hypothetical protein